MKSFFVEYVDLVWSGMKELHIIIHVTPGHVKIGTCDMLSVFPCIRFILNKRLPWKPQKGLQMIGFFCQMVVKTQYLVQYSDLVQYPYKKAIQSLVATSP